ncbi:hypothetical protein DF188_03420 [Aliarcobacter skirrowii]|uniref:DUF4885 domain-containing protein n=2 Tax=Aliarcobacter skirrowii TaxID=28200 RepID=A0A2U2C1G6_9BACT|nr:DUF4885 family protein [Aliarcobacter skirrowii]PWE20788.1 hypothetical protein DGF29_05285 [Aliarcobacter skirrowii]PWE22173.1 hypothetical protein DF188_03420 [Aliarcobacter skirrowii]RJO55869.1 DUF4885 domain-containing protein [Aliarcobacter skirrowii]RJO57825.1 DUF4885 domain-containing protein [Aliarcobacter skirrowii]
MKINTNIQQFSSLSGIKVTQNNYIQQTNKNSEAVNININKNTLNSLNLLSSLDEETFLKAYDNSYINKNREAILKKLDDFYKQENIKNKSFQNPENHIFDKYYNPTSSYYKEGLSKVEREAGYRHELQYLKYNRLGNISFFDTNIKDMKATGGILDEALKRVYYRDNVNEQFSQLLNKYGIEIPKDTNISFTIDPYDYKVSVSGIEDKSLASLLEDVLNTANNSKELFIHIMQSNFEYGNNQINRTNEEKYYLLHEIKNKTGYDLRDLENIDGKFLTEDGIDIIEIYKKGVIETKTIPEEYKGLVFESNVKKLNDLAQKGFLNVPDMILSIDYKNGSFYDVGQSENFGVGKRDWIDKLEATLPKTIGEVFKEYYKDTPNFENKQDIIKEALNLNTQTLDSLKSEAKGLFEEYGTSDMELIKLILMQKYLIGKEDSQADKEFYKLLKEWEKQTKEIT